MEIVGSVTKDQVPVGTRTTDKGLWTSLAQRAVEDYQKGRVTLVMARNTIEVRRMRNSVGAWLRKHGYSLSLTVTGDNGGPPVEGRPMKVYLELREHEEPANAKPVRKLRRAGSR